MRSRAGYMILSVTNNEAKLPNAVKLGDPKEKDYPLQKGKAM
jgi:hypothetical protein